MHVLIIDYWKTFTDEIKSNFKDYKNAITLREAHTKKRGLELIKKGSYDLVIIGLQKKGELESREILLKLKATNHIFIVILGDSEKSIYDQIFDLHPLAVFSIPIDILALKLHIDQLLLDRKTLISESSIESNDYFIFNWKSQLRKELYSDIYYIHTDGNYIKIHLYRNEFLIRHTLKGIEKKLPSHLFIRSHRNYLVNISLIKSIDISNNIVQTGTFKVPIGRKYKKALKEAFSNFDLSQDHRGL